MARTGRPATAQAKFDQNKFEAYLTVRTCKSVVLAVMEISEPSLRRAIKRVYGRKATFDILAHKFGGKTQITTRTTMLTAALAKDSKGKHYNQQALIYATKTLGDLSDKVVIKDDPDQHDERMAAAAATAEAVVEIRERETVRIELLIAALSKASKVGTK